MKAIKNPLVKGLAFVLLILLSALLLSCEPEPIDYSNTDLIKISLEDQKAYTFKDLDSIPSPWHQHKNGAKYTIEYDEDVIIVTGPASEKMQVVYKSIGRAGYALDINDKNQFITYLTPGEETLFEIKY